MDEEQSRQEISDGDPIDESVYKKNLEEYINAQRDIGVDDEVTRNALLQVGWLESDVDAVLINITSNPLRVTNKERLGRISLLRSKLFYLVLLGCVFVVGGLSWYMFSSSEIKSTIPNEPQEKLSGLEGEHSLADLYPENRYARSMEHVRWIDGDIYCVFGDESDPEPSFGYYYSKQKLNIADPSTFMPTDYGMAQDSTGFYSYEATCTTGIPGSCSCHVEKMAISTDNMRDLGRGYMADDTNVYQDGISIDEADGATFELLLDSNGNASEYARDKSTIYWEFFVIDEADYATFEVVSPSMARDKNYLYDGSNPVRGIPDPASFVLLYDKNNKATGFITNGSQVFYEDEALPASADANSFEVLLKYPGVAKDKNNVYRQERLVNKNFIGDKGIELDAATLQVLPTQDAKEYSQYLKDKNGIYNAYWEITKVEGVDADTFTALDANLASDSSIVYIYGQAHEPPFDVDDMTILLTSAGEKTHLVLVNDQIYFMDVDRTAGINSEKIRRIEEADITSFKALSTKLSKDANNYYYADQVLSEEEAEMFINELEVLD